LEAHLFRFKCSKCDEWHEGIPAFATAAPSAYEAMSEEEQQLRGILDEDCCVLDDETFFIRGLIEIPVRGQSTPLVWNVWASIDEEAFAKFVQSYEQLHRAHIGPFEGRLSARLPIYPDTENLGLRVHLRDKPLRPIFELQLSEHPLAVEQQEGITTERLSEIVEQCLH
jgi:hypothetical protein